MHIKPQIITYHTRSIFTSDLIDQVTFTVSSYLISNFNSTITFFLSFLLVHLYGFSG